jgi:hypothetical protein
MNKPIVGLTLALSTLSLAAAHQRVAAQGAPEIQLGKRTGATAEPLSDMLGMAELPDGRVIVTDRIERALFIVDFKTGERKRLGSNGAGPNEYELPISPIRWRGDTVVTLDGFNRRALRIAPNGALAGTVALALPRAGGVTSTGPYRGVDRAGRLYWDAPVILREPVIKRALKAKIVRWVPGSDSVEVVHEFVDHAESEDRFRYSPMRQTDAWVAAPDGRIGVLSASEYRLRWYRDGTLLETGPALTYTPVPVTAAEREAFWETKALEPASGASANGNSRPATRAIGLERAKQSWPDSLFPKQMPPFELQGARLAANGTVWVTRSMPASEKSARIDILDAHGALRAILRLPPGSRLFALGADAVYLIATDDDGMQTLERYSFPTQARP